GEGVDDEGVGDAAATVGGGDGEALDVAVVTSGTGDDEPGQLVVGADVAGAVERRRPAHVLEAGGVVAPGRPERVLVDGCGPVVMPGTQRADAVGPGGALRGTGVIVECELEQGEAVGLLEPGGAGDRRRPREQRRGAYRGAA